MSDIKNKVKEYVFNNFLMGGDGQEIGDDESFLEAGILDSTGVIELVSYLEEEFMIAVQDEELIPENLDSLNGIEQYVKQKQI